MKLIIIPIIVLSIISCRENLWRIINEKDIVIEYPVYPITGILTDSGIGAEYERYSDKLIIIWTDPSPNKYILTVKNGTNTLIFTIQPAGMQTVIFSDFSLEGDELLTVYFEERTDPAGDLVQTFSEFNFQL